MTTNNIQSDNLLALEPAPDGYYTMKRILIVEDERLFAQLLCDALSDQEDTEVVVAHNGREALEIMDESQFDLLLTDIHMPELNGRELLKNLRSRDNQVGIIVLTAFPEVDYIKEFNDLGIVEFLSKDECDLSALQELVADYFHRQKVDFLADAFDE